MDFAARAHPCLHIRHHRHCETAIRGELCAESLCSNSSPELVKIWRPARRLHLRIPSAKSQCRRLQHSSSRVMLVAAAVAVAVSAAVSAIVEETDRAHGSPCWTFSLCDETESRSLSPAGFPALPFSVQPVLIGIH